MFVAYKEQYMKKIRIFLLFIALVAFFKICTLDAQRGGYHGGGGGRGYYGGFHGGGHMHGYNHYGWGARPYIGVTTVPFGFYGYYGPDCGYVGYWHQWRCW
jgi:hypothetical protein